MVGNAYREFQTAMISGISLVLEPLGKDAERMHVILDSFLKDHQESECEEELEETTRREVKIIELLKDKAVQARQHGATRIIQQESVASDTLTDAQLNANLLLNLQQSRNVPTHGRSASEHSLPAAIRGTYPTVGGMTTVFNSVHSLAGPDFTLGTGMGGMPQSPTFQRVQAQTSASARNSPVASGSPINDEEMAAQNMLDHWFNASTNPSPMLTEPLNGNGNYNTSLGSGQWGTFSTTSGSGVADWLSAPYNLNDVNIGLEGSDYSYWESLVNTIRGNPMQ